MKAEIKAVCSYKGHSVKQSGSIDFKLKAEYGELTNMVQLLQMLNNDISISAKLPNQKKEMKLGTFMIKTLSVDHDGETSVSFNSTNDFVEIDNINNVISDEPFRVTFKAEIEEEDQAGNEEDDEDWD